ncbi:MAG TPA: hypothetical protein VFO10_02175 [Oligoflexus sp.]|uniref:hypothetical protein n=1 Tax=Oligoflexus sp. TaxID=1971216 RepID=UPI002D7E8031|nr:hypothetical protein [Oligoflexus sp.]HET9236026.1 hypothetical protein [Oligoflexus sp.]
MKARVHITLFTAASLLGAAAFFFPKASSAPSVSASQKIVKTSTQKDSVSQLAAPLLHREFTSTCISGKDGFYKEKLSFAADATTTFARHYFADAACLQPSEKESVQAGHFAVAEEEEGQLLLIVRNLQDKKSADVTPYFEALIKVDREQLVMQNSPSTSLHYTASTKSI